MTRYVLSEAAQADVFEIWAYLHEHAGPEIALGLVDELRNAMRKLASNPHIGHPREDLTPLAVLFWPVQSYLVIYNPQTKPLSVARVVHASRNVRFVLKENNGRR